MQGALSTEISPGSTESSWTVLLTWMVILMSVLWRLSPHYGLRRAELVVAAYVTFAEDYIRDTRRFPGVRASGPGDCLGFEKVMTCHRRLPPQL